MKANIINKDWQHSLNTSANKTITTRLPAKSPTRKTSENKKANLKRLRQNVPIKRLQALPHWQQVRIK
jgi:hypothetical protein